MRYAIALPLLSLATPLAAQDHDHSAHQAVEQPPAETEAQNEPSEMDHSAMDHSAMDHGAMDHSAMDHASPTAPSAGPPPRAFEGPRHAADEIYGTPAMTRGRDELLSDMGGSFRTASLMAERLETRLGEENSYLWDLQGFIGGDLDRLVLKSEGEGDLDSGHVGDAEVQALWSHAISPWIDLQAGARVDFEPETRTHAVLGVQGPAPYMIHFDAAAFLSDRGDLTARIEAEYDQKITQRLILQPRIEVEASAQDIPERGTGAGLTAIAAGARLRYEIAREFAPYVGVEWERRTGDTPDYARAGGEDVGGVSFLLGIRSWF